MNPPSARSKPNHLIIVADDFGMSSEINAAVELGHRLGVLSAAGLMVSGPAAAEAVALARDMPKLRVGLHVAVTQAHSILPPEEVPDLVDAQGNLPTNLFPLALGVVLLRRVRSQMAAEIAAQFEAFAMTGLPLDHVSVHQHMHVHPTIGRIIMDLGRRFGMRALRVPREPASVLRRIGARRRTAESLAMKPGIGRLLNAASKNHTRVADAVFGLSWTGDMTAERLATLLAVIPSGVVEIYLHPATANEFPGHAPGYRYRQELEALIDAEVRLAINRSGRATGGYSDVGAATATV